MKPKIIFFAILVALPGVFSLLVATTHEVGMTPYVFTPDSLSILVGDTVRWVCHQGNHTTTSGTNGTADGKWDSGFMAPGVTFIHVFTETGRNPYFCKPHWQLGMVGVIVVKAAGVEETLPAYPLNLAILPNPFVGTTTITYSLPTGSHVRITIYDVAGKVIRTLVDGIKPAGFNREVWKGDDDSGMRLGAGVYFACLRAGNFCQTQKLLLVRNS